MQEVRQSVCYAQDIRIFLSHSPLWIHAKSMDAAFLRLRTLDPVRCALTNRAGSREDVNFPFCEH